MTVRKNPAAGGGRVFEDEKTEETSLKNSPYSDPVQVRRLGASRRLIDGRWRDATTSTAMLQAMLNALARAQRVAHRAHGTHGHVQPNTPNPDKENKA